MSRQANQKRISSVHLPQKFYSNFILTQLSAPAPLLKQGRPTSKGVNWIYLYGKQHKYCLDFVELQCWAQGKHVVCVKDLIQLANLPLCSNLKHTPVGPWEQPPALSFTLPQPHTNYEPCWSCLSESVMMGKIALGHFNTNWKVHREVLLPSVLHEHSQQSWHDVCCLRMDFSLKGSP